MSNPNKNELTILPIQDPNADTPDYQDIFSILKLEKEHPEYGLPGAEKMVQSEATAEEVTEVLKKALGH